MQKSTYWQGVWRLADPKISLASFAGIFLGASFAAADGSLHFGWLALTVLGVFLVEVGKNAAGEIVDFDSGTDQAISTDNRSPFSGGKRVLVDDLLTRQQTRLIAGACFLAAIGVGLLIVWLRDSRVLVFGIIGMALAWYYHGGRVKLAYRGLGEIAVMLAYGPLVVCGTYFVQTGYLNAALIHASMVLGLLVAAFLWINEFPDYAADKAAGKNNLVVRLGYESAALAYSVIMVTAYLWLVLSAEYYPGARGMLWGICGVLPATFSAWRLLESKEVTPRLIPAQAAALCSFLLMALGSGVGYYLFAAG
jgi:1,4-dihydroxy-2-naphthoate octaprenyltransferase